MPEEEDPWENYESGPFCWHWGTPGDCEQPCLREGCDHTCNDHDPGCRVKGCDCKGIMYSAYGGVQEAFEEA